MGRTDRVTRRELLAAGALSAGLAAAAAPMRATAARRDFRLALSVSPFTEMVLAQGIRYTDGERTAATTEELQRLFVAHGATEVYARIGTRRRFTPGNGDHGVERGLERARLAKKLGLPFNPELGLFRSYGDITGQPSPDFAEYPTIKVPGPWHTLSLAQMIPVLRDYGASIATEILATGVKVNYWDLGNEVEFGVAGVAVSPAGIGSTQGYQPPDAIDPEIGKMTALGLMRKPEAERGDWLAKHLWPHVGKLFAAVAAGIRSVDRSARFSTHSSGVFAYTPALAVRFFQTMGDNGYLPDQLGTSYYPSSGPQPPHRFERFQETAAALHGALQRPLFVAEFAYPAGPGFHFGPADWSHRVEQYPTSPQGQADFLRDLVAWGLRTGHLAGIRPWAPDFPMGWDLMSLFELKDKLATARPALRALAEGLLHAA